ncbi:MAG: conjugative transposon protein TraM [Candidatus Pedobacter colombiensis]|uniref:Conjugative transposon protein TraM n=1 Tax=Candidatus Pedobacter colombiensis TaxID=3121371 RepID=A0AAJ5WB71_9SPHI|nr:conjugative transposon protein TraM [Pedobacter sp.]WEK21366.1 MAG: conjugative transposon protein TraM [Pedobacter sp.]
MVQQTQKKEKQRKLLIALPVLVFPFLTLMFWTLGGGKGNQAKGSSLKQGFNAELPVANNKVDPQDKMGFYTLAEKDSLERTKQLKNDPYYNEREMGFPEDAANELQSASGNLATNKSSGFNTSVDSYDRNETKVYAKLNALQAALQQAPDEAKQQETPKKTTVKDYGMGNDIDRLEQLMGKMNSSSGNEDPEMKQIHGVLESILDIQHPDRVQQRIRKSSELNKGNVYPVAVSQATDPVSMLTGKQTFQARTLANGFYGLDNGTDLTLPTSNIAIQAVVHETQTLVNGSTVKLRLTDAVYINGVYIPKDQFVFGIANLSGERLIISINSIRNENMLFPVDLNVYDMDGLAGIYIPGAIGRDVAKQGGERTVQGFGMTTLDPSLGAQAASAGIEMTRNLLSKKVKLVKVQVKAGYQVMLLDEKLNKNN